MLRVTSVLAFISFFLGACTSGFSAIDQASENYKTQKDYASLELIYKKLTPGMSESEVQNLLGRPDASPQKGKFYYVSTESFYSEEHQREVTIGLILDYRVSDKKVADTLQNYWVGQLDNKSKIVTGL